MFLSNHLPRLDLGALAAAIVTILSAEPKSRDWNMKDENGEERSGTIRSQSAKLEVNGFAYPYKVRLEDGQSPWPVGEYVLDLAAMCQVNKESINLSKYPVLVALKNVAAPAAAK